MASMVCGWFASLLPTAQLLQRPLATARSNFWMAQFWPRKSILHEVTCGWLCPQVFKWCFVVKSSWCSWQLWTSIRSLAKNWRLRQSWTWIACVLRCGFCISCLVTWLVSSCWAFGVSSLKLPDLSSRLWPGVLADWEASAKPFKLQRSLDTLFWCESTWFYLYVDAS